MFEHVFNVVCNFDECEINIMYILTYIYIVRVIKFYTVWFKVSDREAGADYNQSEVYSLILFVRTVLKCIILLEAMIDICLKLSSDVFIWSHRSVLKSKCCMNYS